MTSTFEKVLYVLESTRNRAQIAQIFAFSPEKEICSQAFIKTQIDVVE